MATIANREYIKGFAVKVGDEYPTTVSIYNYNLDVDAATGFFMYKTNITSLHDALIDRQTVESIEIRTKNAISLYQFARRCGTITKIDCRNVEATNLYFAFGINAPDYNNGYRMNLQKIVLPIVRKTTTNTTNCLSRTAQLTDVEATFIENSISFSQSPLTLQSAINILNALQDLQGGSATITFSSTTSALVQEDTAAMNLVAQAQSFGWTITFN